MTRNYCKLILSNILLLACFHSPLIAGQIEVTSPEDAGPGTLRQAIANAQSGDTLTFSPDAGRVILSSGHLFIDKNLVMLGNGREATILDGSGITRLLYIEAGVTVVITDLSVTNGYIEGTSGTADTPGNWGAGIYNAGTLRLAHCNIHDNYNFSADVETFGGGIHNGGAMVMENCRVFSNVIEVNDGEFGTGAGIKNIGNLLVRNSAIFRNRFLLNGTGEGEGAGIDADLNGHSTRIENSTISENEATRSVGIYCGLDGDIHLFNTTISSNIGERSGITIAESGSLSSCTIARNSTIGFVITNGASVEISNTVLEGHPEGDMRVGVGATVNSRATSISDFSYVLLGPGDATNAALNLQPLEFNGGTGRTHMPGEGSQAIDTGDNNFATAEDQRRYQRIWNGTIDRGAVETRTLAFEPDQQPVSANILETSAGYLSFEIAPGESAAERFLVVRKDTTLSAAPQDRQTWLPGQQINGNTVVAVGPELVVLDTGLLPGTAYTWEVYGYNGFGQATNYLNASPLTFTGSTITAPRISHISPASANTGDTLTITGSGFANGIDNNTVYLGHTPAQVISATATSLQAIVPEGVASLAMVQVLNLQTGLVGTSADADRPWLSRSFPGVIDSIGSYQARQISTEYPLQKIAQGDFNSDGFADLALAGGPESVVQVVLFNVETGHFDPPVNLAALSDITDLLAADFDNDGFTDLAVVAAGTQAEMLIFFQDEEGDFPESESFSFTFQIERFRAGDFNADGLVDLAVVQRAGTNQVLGVLWQQAIGDRFGSVAPLLLQEDFTGLETGDFNRDGFADIAASAAGTNETLHLLSYRPQQKNFGFSEVPGIAGKPERLAQGDFNGDGLADLAVVAGTGPRLQIFTGNGQSGFSLLQQTSLAQVPLQLLPADLNGNGLHDLLLLYSDQVALWLNNGEALLAERARYPLPSTSVVRMAATGDFNPDQKTDIAITGSDSKTLDLLLYTPPPLLVQSVNPAKNQRDFSEGAAIQVVFDRETGTLPGTWLAQASGSLSGRVIGATAAVSGNELQVELPAGYSFWPGEEVTVMLNGQITGFDDGPLGKYEWKFHAATSASVGWLSPGDSVAGNGHTASVVLGDFNGDPLPDMAIADLEGQELSVYRRDAGGWSLVNRQSLGSRVSLLKAADIDSNGLTDLLTFSAENRQLTVLQAMGNSTFTALQTISFGDNMLPADAATGDFDGDGDVDLLLASGSTGSLLFLENSGTGNFTVNEPQALPTANTAVSALAVEDFNNDGLADLLIGHEGGNGLWVIYLNEAGDFMEVLQLAAGSFGAVATGDLNTDGFRDVAAWNSESKQVIIFLQDTIGNWSVSGQAEVASAAALAVADIDADVNGAPDLLVLDNSTHHITIFRNNTEGAFYRYFQQPVNLWATGFALADVDNDQDLDVVTVHSNAGGHHVTWLNQNIPSVALAANPVPGGEFMQGTPMVLAGGFSLKPSGNHAVLQRASFATLGSYTAADLQTDGWKLWMTETADFTTGRQLLGSQQAAGSGENVGFDLADIAIPQDQERFFWLTADLDTFATIGHQLQAGTLLADSLYFLHGRVRNIDSLPPGNPVNIVKFIKPEPGGHATGFAVAQLNSTAINVSWFDAGISPLPDGYLLLAVRAGTAFPVVADGVPIPEDTDWADGVAAVHVPQTGFLNGYTFQGLQHSVRYTFRLYPYTNDSTDTDYKIAGVPETETLIVVEPSAQATGINFTNIGTTGAQLNWTSGSGLRRMLVINQGTSAGFFPVDDVAYTAGEVFGTGSDLGEQHFVVYQGTGNSSPVTGLQPGQNYVAQVLEFNENGLLYDYLLAPASGNPASFVTTATEPVYPAQNLQVSQVAPEALQISFQPPPGTADGFLIVRREGGSPSAPKDRVVYAAGDSFGGQTVVYFGTDTLFTDTGLQPETRYFYEVYVWNGQGESVNYLQSAFASGDFLLPALEPQVRASNLAITGRQADRASFAWQNGDGAARLAVAAQDTTPGTPADRQSYLASPQFALGDTVSGGSYTVFDGTGGSLDLTGLQPETTYQLAIYEYNGSVQTTNYLGGTDSGNLLAFTTLATVPLATTLEYSIQQLTATSVGLAFSATAPLPNGYLVVRRTGGTAAQPLNGTAYSPGEALGEGTVIQASAQTAFLDEGLQPASTWFYDIYLFNGNGETASYLPAPALTVQVTTLSPEPLQGVQQIIFSEVHNSRITGTLLPPAQAADGYLLLYTTDSLAQALPRDGISYTPGSTLNGLQVYSWGSNLALDLQELPHNTRYFFEAYAFNGSGASINYFQAGRLRADTVTWNTAPLSLSLSDSSVREFAPAGTLVGRLATVDPDPADQHTWQLASGTGDEGNGFFRVNGDSLLVNGLLRFTLQPSVPVRLRVEDGKGGAREAAFNIQVREIPLHPQDSLRMWQLYDSIGNFTSWGPPLPVKHWQGVEVVAGRVVSLDLSALELPYLHTAAIAGLDSLQRLNLAGNRLYMPWLEPLAGLPEFTYLPQELVFETDTVWKTSLDSYRMAVPAAGEQTVYQWLLGDLPLPAATAPELELPVLNADKSGLYTCLVSNTLLPGLEFRLPHTLLNVVNVMLPADSLALVQVLEGMYNLPVAQVVDLGQPAATWPGVAEEGGRVTGLGFGNGGLTGTLPAAIGQLGALRRLDLFNNQLTGELPAEIGDLTQLEYLDLFGNEFEGAVPASLGNLRELGTLWLAENRFTSLPETLGNLEQLRFLFVQGNLLASLPASVNQLARLHTLDASDNQLQELPPQLSGLAELQVLNLSGNRLSVLPAQVAELPRLAEIDISNNFLHTLPPGLKNLPMLSVLRVFNNLLDFADLEPLEVTSATFTALYAPQRLLGQPADTLLAAGSRVQLPSGIGGSSNNFTWLDAQGQAVANGPALVLDPLTTTHVGSYHCQATSPLVPGLLLRTAAVNLLVDCGEQLQARITTSFDTDICQGQQVYVELLAQQTEEGLAWQWLKDNEPLPLATSARYVAFEPGSYRLRVTSADGCSAVSEPVEVRVLPAPRVDLWLTDSLTLQAASNGTGGHFTWYLDGQPLEGAAGPVLQINRQGFYTAGYTGATGCEGLSDGLQVVVTSVTPASPGQQALQQTLLAPNPTTGLVTLYLPGTTRQAITVKIIDLGGNVLEQMQVRHATEVPLNLQQYPAGLYLIGISTPEGQIFKKVKKQ